MSEQQRQTRDLHQTFIDRKLSLTAGAIERARAGGKIALRDGMTPVELARAIELAAHGLDLKKGDANLLADLERSVRLMVAGALAAAPEAIATAPLKETAMTSALINGRAATLPDDPEALLVDVLRDQLASDRDQARLRRRRLRRVHGSP